MDGKAQQHTLCMQVASKANLSNIATPCRIKSFKYYLILPPHMG